MVGHGVFASGRSKTLFLQSNEGFTLCVYNGKSAATRQGFKDGKHGIVLNKGKFFYRKTHEHLDRTCTCFIPELSDPSDVFGGPAGMKAVIYDPSTRIGRSILFKTGNVHHRRVVHRVRDGSCNSAHSAGRRSVLKIFAVSEPRVLKMNMSINDAG